MPYKDKSKEKERSRRYYLAHKKEVLDYSLKYRKEHAEDRRAYDHFRYHNNPERKAATLAWQKEHPEQNIKRCREWRKQNPDYPRIRYKENPEYMKSQVNKRRTLKSKAGGSYTAEQFKFLCEINGNKCLCCNKSKVLTADHVIPVSKNGTSNIDNIQPLCRPCNTRKMTKCTDYRSKRWKTHAKKKLNLP